MRVSQFVRNIQYIILKKNKINLEKLYSVSVQTH